MTGQTGNSDVFRAMLNMYDRVALYSIDVWGRLKRKSRQMCKSHGVL